MDVPQLMNNLRSNKSLGGVIEISFFLDSRIPLIDKITLTPQEILEKDFKIDTRGYRLKEVDQFLDVIIGDYEQFFAIIDSLEKEKAELLREIMALKQDLRNAKMNVEIARKNTDTTEVSNLDILRRLSQLEKEVYGRDDN